MEEAGLDSDGNTAQMRASIIDRAVRGVRAHNIEPAAQVLDWFRQYVSGGITRQQLMALLYERSAAVHTELATRLDAAYGSGGDKAYRGVSCGQGFLTPG